VALAVAVLLAVAQIALWEPADTGPRRPAGAPGKPAPTAPAR